METPSPAYVDVEPITKGFRNEQNKSTQKQIPSFLGYFAQVIFVPSPWTKAIKQYFSWLFLCQAAQLVNLH